jgi:hypothetical protein
MKFSVGTLIISDSGKFGIIISKDINKYIIAWDTYPNTSVDDSSIQMMISHNKWHIEK